MIFISKTYKKVRVFVATDCRRKTMRAILQTSYVSTLHTQQALNIMHKYIKDYHKIENRYIPRLGEKSGCVQY